MRSVVALTAGAPGQAFVTAIAVMSILVLLLGRGADLAVALAVEVAWAVGVALMWLGLMRTAHAVGAEDADPEA